MVRLRYRRLALLIIVCTSAWLVWMMATKPVLFHTDIWARGDEQRCGEYNQVVTGITILNPFRSRLPEQRADAFMHAASNAECTPDLSISLCDFVRRRPLPAGAWQLVNRRDSTADIRLFYRLNTKRQEGARVAGVRRRPGSLGKHWWSLESLWLRCCMVTIDKSWRRPAVHPTLS